MSVDTNGTDTETTSKSKKRFRLQIPTAFTILFFLTIIAVIATWLVPAGQYSKLAYDQETNVFSITSPQGEVKEIPGSQESLDKLDIKIKYEQFENGSINKPISVPGTYQRLKPNPAGLDKVPLAMVQGTMEAVDIMVFIFTLGGLIGVVRATGAFESGLVALTKKTKGHEFVLVFAMSIFMVISGTLCGLEEEAVAFYPIMCPIFIAMGYDAIVTMGAIFLAGSMGVTMSISNPFSVVIASNTAGVPFTEGVWWRIGGCIVGSAVVIGYLYWYAKRVKANPEFSYAWEDRERYQKKWGVASGEVIPFTWRRVLILLLFFAGFPIMVWGVMAWHWDFPLMAASFLTIAVVIIALALTGKDRLNEKQLVDAFSEGSSSLVSVSLIIGLARGINLVLKEGYISDTILDGATNLVTGMNGSLFILMMLLIFFVLGFIVPSSSGLAVLSMPIMAPLADSVGIPRWIIVCAYQWGQYAMLYIAPTGLVMATLQMLDIKYTHWLKFVWPMVIFVLIFGGALLVAQTMIYGA